MMTKILATVMLMTKNFQHLWSFEDLTLKSEIQLNQVCKHDNVWENDEKSFHFFVFQICSFALWCLYMIIHVCSSSRRKIKGNEYKLRTIRTLSCPVSCIFMNKPKQKYNQATNKMEKDKIKWIALIRLLSRHFKNLTEKSGNSLVSQHLRKISQHVIRHHK